MVNLVMSPIQIFGFSSWPNSSSSAFVAAGKIKLNAV